MKNINQLKVIDNMSNNNIYSDEIIKRQAAILLEMREGVGIHGYICYDDRYTRNRRFLWRYGL